MLPKLGPIPMKDRRSVVFLERGQLDVRDGAFVLLDDNGERTQIPIGGLACVMLEPGTRVSHAAVALAARVRCLLIWVGEAGVRLYAAGFTEAANPDKLVTQARAYADDTARLAVVREMYRLRFEEDAPSRRSVDQLRGIEANRVKALYKHMARQHGVTWRGRQYDPKRPEKADTPNRCLNAATACLYGITEAAILIAGYSPSIGFLHVGKDKSFVYDVADIFKFDTVVPAAFKTAATNPPEPEREVRRACRDAFRRTDVLGKLIPTVEGIIAASGLAPTQRPEESLPVAIEERTRNDGRGD